MEQKMYRNIYKKLYIKDKLVNHIMKNGKKSIVENLMLKSYKEIQKMSSTDTKSVFELALLNTIIAFKIDKTNKKKKKTIIIIEKPRFLKSNNTRFSLALKLILKTLNKKISFFLSFSDEIFYTSQNGSKSTEKILNIQKHVILLSKKYSDYFHW